MVPSVARMKSPGNVLIELFENVTLLGRCMNKRVADVALIDLVSVKSPVPWYVKPPKVGTLRLYPEMFGNTSVLPVL